MKRGFEGPSMCYLYHSTTKDPEHLPNYCSFSQHLWDQGMNIFQQSNQNRAGIRETLSSWRKQSLTTTLSIEHGNYSQDFFFGSYVKKEIEEYSIMHSFQQATLGKKYNQTYMKRSSHFNVIQRTKLVILKTNPSSKLGISTTSRLQKLQF